MARKEIIVMSDSHGDRDIVCQIKDYYLGQVDAIFHNGDSELASDDPVWEGIHVVGGNVDYSGYQDHIVTKIGQDIICQTHGHLFGINFSFQKLDLWAQENEATICLFGHLHRPMAWQEEGTLFVNPGSISQPRGEVQACLYAKLILDNDKITVSYYTRSHQLYMKKEFRR